MTFYDFSHFKSCRFKKYHYSISYCFSDLLVYVAYVLYLLWKEYNITEYSFRLSKMLWRVHILLEEGDILTIHK